MYHLLARQLVRNTGARTKGHLGPQDDHLTAEAWKFLCKSTMATLLPPLSLAHLRSLKAGSSTPAQAQS